MEKNGKVRPLDILRYKIQQKQEIKDFWNVMHTFAINLPNKVESDDKSDLAGFFESSVALGLSRNKSVQKLLREFLGKKPIVTEGRKEVSEWVCKMHNYVNLVTDKQLFNCDFEVIKERWSNSV